MSSWSWSWSSWCSSLSKPWQSRCQRCCHRQERPHTRAATQYIELSRRSQNTEHMVSSKVCSLSASYHCICHIAIPKITFVSYMSVILGVTHVCWSHILIVFAIIWRCCHIDCMYHVCHSQCDTWCLSYYVCLKYMAFVVLGHTLKVSH